MSKVTKRRRAIREALLGQGGPLDVEALAEAWGVSARTIGRDLRVIRREWETTVAFFETQRDWALRRAKDLDEEMPESARVAWMRLAVEAENKRMALLELKAPPADEDGAPEVVMRIESPPGQPVVRPPVPAKHLAGAKHRVGG